MEVRHSNFAGFIDYLTSNTYVMVIMSDPTIRKLLGRKCFEGCCARMAASGCEHVVERLFVLVNLMDRIRRDPHEHQYCSEAL